MSACDSCRILFRQDILRAASLPWDSAGSSIAARIAIIAITTSSSISVNAGLAAAGWRALLLRTRGRNSALLRPGLMLMPFIISPRLYAGQAAFLRSKTNILQFERSKGFDFGRAVFLCLSFKVRLWLRTRYNPRRVPKKLSHYATSISRNEVTRTTSMISRCFFLLICCLMPESKALASGGFLQIRDGYFWDPLAADYFVPRGMAHQTWNPPRGANQSFSQVEYDLVEFKKMHANSVRAEMVWNVVENSHGNFDWSKPDYLVAK